MKGECVSIFYLPFFCQRRLGCSFEGFSDKAFAVEQVGARGAPGLLGGGENSHPWESETLLRVILRTHPHSPSPVEHGCIERPRGVS